jgi:hypothetical protein
MLGLVVRFLSQEGFNCIDIGEILDCVVLFFSVIKIAVSSNMYTFLKQKKIWFI